MDPFCGFYMAQTSNNLARDYGISREEQDAFAVSSQDKAVAAMAAGQARRGDRAGHGRRGQARGDRHPGRAPATGDDDRESRQAPDRLRQGRLRHRRQRLGDRRRRRHAAAGSTKERAAELGKKPLGRILAWATVGVEPSRMGIGPAPAIHAALAKAGMRARGPRPDRDQRGVRRSDPGLRQGARARRREAQRQRRRHRPRPPARSDRRAHHAHPDEGARSAAAAAGASPRPASAADRASP